MHLSCCTLYLSPNGFILLLSPLLEQTRMFFRCSVLFQQNRATLLWRVLPPVLYRFSQHSTLLSVKIPENSIPGEGRHACRFTLPYRPVSRSWWPAWLSCLFPVHDVVFPFPSSAFFFLFCFTACAPISRYLPLARRNNQTWKEHQKKTHLSVSEEKK